MKYLTDEQILAKLIELRDSFRDAMIKAKANDSQDEATKVAYWEAREEWDETIRALDRFSWDCNSSERDHVALYEKLRTVWHSSRCATDELVVLTLELLVNLYE